MIKAHIIHEETGVLLKPRIDFVPRVGDEIRLSGERYYRVTVVVWVFDEPGPDQRVNIGVTDINAEQEQPHDPS